MSLTLYMDVHVQRAVTNALRLRKIDVLTAQEDRAALFSDPQLLDWAGVLGRVLFSQDDDLLREAAARQRTGQVPSPRPAPTRHTRGKTASPFCPM